MTSYEMFVEKFKKRYQEVHNLTDEQMNYHEQIILGHAFQCAVVLMFNNIFNDNKSTSRMLDYELEKMIK